MNNDSNKEEVKIEAGRNTAHVVGKAAATKFGGRLGGAAYDKLAETRLGQRLERGIGKNIASSPIGNINKKLNDSGAVDAASKVVDGKNKNNTNNALAKNKANRRNYLSFLNRKTKNNSVQDDGSNSEDGVQEENNETESVSAILKKAKKIKMALTIAIPVIAFLLIIFVLIAIVGYIANMFGIVSTGGGGEWPTAMTDNANEKKYYEKLDSVVKSYRESCGIELNKNYIHTLLIYPTNNYNDFFDQEFSLEDIKNENNSVNYDTLSGKVDTVASLFVNSCNVDYEIDGASYNRIKNSSFFKDYYKDLLKNADADTILTDVFDLAEVGTNLFASSWFINDNLKVNLGNCKYENGKYLDQEVNNTVGFSDYIMGVIYGEMGSSYIIPENKEFLKAFTIAASSYVLSRSGYQSGDTEISARNGNCWQLSADINNGSTYIKDGEFSTMYPGKLDGGTYFAPLSNDKRQILNEVFNEVFGILMINDEGQIKYASYRNTSTLCGDNECLGQQDAVRDAQSGMSYQQILNKYYSNFTLTNAQEDLYADNVTYDDGGYTKTEVISYRQTDYKQKFCGRTNGTISSSGCGVVSMSIVLSTLVDDSYNPVVVMNEAQNFGSCGPGISGTNSSFFKKSAKLHNLGYKAVSKKGNLQSVLDALKSGNSLVIAHMGKGTFTGGGHYLVLSAVRDDGKVYVVDPYHDVNKKKRNSGDGWYDFNSVIVKQLAGSLHIITKG